MVSIYYKDGSVTVASVQAEDVADVIVKLNLNIDYIEKITLYKNGKKKETAEFIDS